ncbi:hypothetical protein ACFX13_043268 [Malus domestica]
MRCRRCRISLCTCRSRVNVPDERFNWLCQLYKPKSEVSAFLEIHDIAGLVLDAHEGQGLGNSFLSHIRVVDGISHVLRAFEDPNIIHVDDTVDPMRDLEIISAELRLNDCIRQGWGTWVGREGAARSRKANGWCRAKEDAHTFIMHVPIF